MNAQPTTSWHHKTSLNSFIMGKKRRNTAKTGDQKLYQGRQKQQQKNQRGKSADNQHHDSDGDDSMVYNHVDRFHNRREEEQFIQLDGGGGGDDDNSSSSSDHEEAVMDLGMGGESSSEEEEEEEEVDGDDNDSVDRVQKRMARVEAQASSSDDDDDDDDDEMEPTEDVRDWGKRKSVYYHGDTADLEIGQDEDDAYLEEEAAKEIQAARFKEMSEDDFVLSEGDEEEARDQRQKKGKDGSSKMEEVTIARDVMMLTTKEKQKLLDKHHSELLPLLSHFTPTVNDLETKTAVAVQALLEGEEGTPEVCTSTATTTSVLYTRWHL